MSADQTATYLASILRADIKIATQTFVVEKSKGENRSRAQQLVNEMRHNRAALELINVMSDYVVEPRVE